MDSSDDEKKFHTGLHGGFYWRDTLVQAWMNLAPCLGVDTIEIQGAEMNRWNDGYRIANLLLGYDKVAERMGFESNEGSRIWTRPIFQTQNDILRRKAA